MDQRRAPASAPILAGRPVAPIRARDTVPQAVELDPSRFSIASRGLYPLLDQLSVQPYDQITMAVKLQNETPTMPNERTGVRRAVTPNET